MTLYTPYTSQLQRRGKHDGFPHVISYQDGYLMAYQEGGTEETDVNANKLVLRRSTDGINWSGPVAIYDEIPNYAVKTGGLTRGSDGTLYLVYNRVAAGNDLQGFLVLRSSDKGYTWSEPVQISALNTAVGAPIIELANTTLITPFYWGVDGFKSARYFTSADGGDTWGNETVISNGSDYSLDFVEPNVSVLASGTWLCLIRCTTDGNIYSCTSADGVTWSVPAIAFLGNSAPHMTQLSTGMIVVVYRGPGFTSSLITSSDDGATWSDPLSLLPDDPWNMYGQVVELPGSRIGVAFGCMWAIGDGSLNYKVLDFADLPT